MVEELSRTQEMLHALLSPQNTPTPHVGAQGRNSDTQLRQKTPATPLHFRLCQDCDSHPQEPASHPLAHHASAAWVRYTSSPIASAQGI